MIALLLACAEPAPEDAADRDPDADLFLASHNAVRAGVIPPTDPPLPDLIWGQDLAKIASDHAERCVYEHSSAPAPGADYGENIAFFGGDDPTFSTADLVVVAWASEVAFYTYEDNSCLPDEVCGHYTQIVWRDTARVGCGVALCDLFETQGLFWVCNYDPPGNWVGEWPY